MATSNILEIYEQYIEPLPEADQLRLVELIALRLASSSGKQPKPRSILDLEGLGAELWQGIEAQDYVRELRKEWDHRP